MKQALQRIPLLLLAILTASYSVAADTKPIRVFVLAGQSNMEGAGLIKADPKRNGGQGSLEFLVKDAATAKHFAFVIAETGMGGPEETHPRALSLMKAQAAVVEHEEFKGNVAFVGTKAFWRPKERSPSGQNYHWNSNAETYYLIGEGMGEAMKRLLNVK